MITRLGNTFYWAGCVLAALVIGFGILVVFNDPFVARYPGLVLLVTATSSILIWLLGRAARYVLAGT